MVGGYDVASHVCVCVCRSRQGAPLVREVMFMSAIKIVTESSPFVVLRGALEGKTKTNYCGTAAGKRGTSKGKWPPFGRGSNKLDTIAYQSARAHGGVTHGVLKPFLHAQKIKTNRKMDSHTLRRCKPLGSVTLNLALG